MKDHCGANLSANSGYLATRGSFGDSLQAIADSPGSKVTVEQAQEAIKTAQPFCGAKTKKNAPSEPFSKTEPEPCLAAGCLGRSRMRKDFH
jgi:hypothetical protein